ncbi:ubiquinone biosynthesis accessory factor UbiK [Legionella londiniensis]|uniref:Ubiquinone biosynthesis accessory factor UbiK n=1 Tax=Legionella londiniensis TaxID=45068 RepID=A0A0W0VLW2_9GAMM|nr:accessory factor UbiK family protein [Legionella londiniensis]KTD21080.1 Membrane fusogenic activity [Legionella londiniensis]STX93656.1 Uncharacterized protein conserved in bacteria [Legionella londiniensis]
MFDPKQFEEIARKLYASLPASVQNFENEIQQKFKEILQSAFTHLDLVTREEFDVQVKVLARTREKVEALQLQLNVLLAEKQKNENKKKQSPV